MKRECRDMDRFRGGCVCVDGEDSPAVLTVVTAAVTSAATVASTSLKVLWWSALRS